MRCEQDQHCGRPATLYHTTRHADCLPNFPIGVTLAVCILHAETRSHTYTRLVPDGEPCPFCHTPITYPGAVTTTPIETRTPA